jgi:hypothetical protein
MSSTALGSQSLAHSFSILSISFKYLTDLSPVAAKASNIFIFLGSFCLSANSSLCILLNSLMTVRLMSLLNS